MVVLTVAFSTLFLLSACGKKSVAGRLTSAAGSAARGAGSLASGAVSTTASVAGSTASAASNAASSVGGAAGAGAGAGAGASAGVISAPVAVGAANVAFAAAYDYHSKEFDGPAMAEGVANCLRAGPRPEAATSLLTAAGWSNAPDIAPPQDGAQVLTKGNVRAYVLADGACAFRAQSISAAVADENVRKVVADTFPKAKTQKAANRGTGFCDGFTLKMSRRNKAWVHYSDATGGPCNQIGAGVTVQFL